MFLSTCAPLGGQVLGAAGEAFAYTGGMTLQWADLDKNRGMNVPAQLR